MEIIRKKAMPLFLAMVMFATCFGIIAFADKAQAQEVLSGVKITNVTKTSAKVSWPKYKYADKYKAHTYRVYLNGKAKTTTKNKSYTISGLKKNTEYSVKVTVLYDKSKKLCTESFVKKFKTKK